MRIWVLFGIVLLIGCSGQRSVKSDFTSNQSRAKSTRTSSKTPSRKINSVKRNEPKIVEAEDRKKSSGEAAVGNSHVKTESSEATSLLVQDAFKLIGTPYRYGGTTPDRGFDCSGFVSYVFARQRISLPRTSTEQSKYGSRKAVREADVGDLVFFGTGQRVNHVGIVVGKSRNELEVIHSTSSGGVRVDEVYSSPYWKSRTLWAVSVSGN